MLEISANALDRLKSLAGGAREAIAILEQSGSVEAAERSIKAQDPIVPQAVRVAAVEQRVINYKGGYTSREVWDEVNADVLHGLAVYRQKGGWCIGHVSTGRRLGTARNYQRAVKAMRELVKEYDWDRTDWPDEERQRAVQIWARLAEEGLVER